MNRLSDDEAEAHLFAGGKVTDSSGNTWEYTPSGMFRSERPQYKLHRLPRAAYWRLDED